MIDFYNSRLGVAIRRYLYSHAPRTWLRNYVYTHQLTFMLDILRRAMIERTRMKQEIRWLKSEVQRLNGES